MNIDIYVWENAGNNPSQNSQINTGITIHVQEVFAILDLGTNYKCHLKPKDSIPQPEPESPRISGYEDGVI